MSSKGAKIRVEIEEVMERPIEEVFERLVDIRRYPDWMHENGLFIDCNVVSGGAVREGTTYTDRTRLGMVRGEVADFDRPHTVVFHYTARLFGREVMEGWPGYELERTDNNSTRIHHVATGTLRFPLTLIRPLIQRMARNERRRTVEALKKSFQSTDDGGP